MMVMMVVVVVVVCVFLQLELMSVSPTIISTCSPISAYLSIPLVRCLVGESDDCRWHT